MVSYDEEDMAKNIAVSKTLCVSELIDTIPRSVAQTLRFLSRFFMWNP